MSPRIRNLIGQKELAICVRNSGYEASLEPGKAYKVIPDVEAQGHGLLRVVDESGEDYLFPLDWFRPIRVLQWRGHRASPNKGTRGRKTRKSARANIRA